MPRGDGTGPTGTGPIGGKKSGSGQGKVPVKGRAEARTRVVVEAEWVEGTWYWRGLYLPSMRNHGTSRTGYAVSAAEMSSMRNSDGTSMKGEGVGPMKIVFASGKGGTGKTTIAVNLAYFLATFKSKGPVS